jgi:hypothetical protein
MVDIARTLAATSAGLTLSACAIMPDLPPDWAMPQQEILLHTACELQFALKGLDGYTDPTRFNARGWTIKVSLNPKVNVDIKPGAGLTRKNPFVGTPTRFVTWVVGSGSGYTMDMKGERTGNIDFGFDSAKLMDDGKLPCDRETPSYHALTKSLGIKDWLYRSVDAMNLTGATIDKPSFSSDVFIKFDGNSSYTYTYPPGTQLLTLAGYYQLQETLNINLTAKPKVEKIVAVTLPVGGPGSKDNLANARIISTSTVFQEQRSDLQQIEQAIRNQRPATQ